MFDDRELLIHYYKKYIEIFTGKINLYLYYLYIFCFYYIFIYYIILYIHKL